MSPRLANVYASPGTMTRAARRAAHVVSMGTAAPWRAGATTASSVIT